MVLPRPAGSSPSPWRHPVIKASFQAECSQNNSCFQVSCKPTHLDRRLQILCRNGDFQYPWKQRDLQIPDNLPKNGTPQASQKHGEDHEEHLQNLCRYGDLDSAVDCLWCLHAAASTDAYISLLRACNKAKSLTHLTSVRAHLTRYCTELQGFLGDYLVLTLARCGAVLDAYRICLTLPIRTVFSWTAIIYGYADCACGKEALEAFRCMQEDGVEPNSYTFVSLFKACGSMLDLDQGRKLHERARIKGFTSNLFVGNTLVSMFGKCGAVMEAETVFNDLPERDVVSWNAMLSAYIEQDQGKRALLLYRQMQEEETAMSNKETLVLSLQACGAFMEEMAPSGTSVRHVTLDIGRALHATAHKEGYITDTVTSTALLHMYGICGAVVEAEDVFGALSHHDCVSWTALLSAYLEQGQGENALSVFRQMQVEGMNPNELTFVTVLQACRDLGEGVPSLDIVRALYVDACTRGYTADFIVGNPFISMFSKFNGAILDAERVFESLSRRNIVSWNAMLSAYVDQGEVEKGLGLFEKMRKEGVSLTDLTFIAILQDCAELGSLDFCRELHFDVLSTGYDRINPLVATLIHAYGSCGSTVDAHTVLAMHAEPHVVSYNACLAGFAREGSYGQSMRLVIELALAGYVLDDATLTSILSVCSHAGLIVEGFDYFHSVCRGYALSPDVKHYGIMVDLLGRAGDLASVLRLLDRMPMSADLTLWLCLLSACRLHGDLALAERAYDSVLLLQPREGAAYVLFANMHAEISREELEEDA